MDVIQSTVSSRNPNRAYRNRSWLGDTWQAVHEILRNFRHWRHTISFIACKGPAEVIATASGGVSQPSRHLMKEHLERSRSETSWNSDWLWLASNCEICPVGLRRSPRMHRCRCFGRHVERLAQPLAHTAPSIPVQTLEGTDLETVAVSRCQLSCRPFCLWKGESLVARTFAVSGYRTSVFDALKSRVGPIELGKAFKVDTSISVCGHTCLRTWCQVLDCICCSCWKWGCLIGKDLSQTKWMKPCKWIHPFQQVARGTWWHRFETVGVWNWSNLLLICSSLFNIRTIVATCYHKLPTEHKHVLVQS